ncbi:DUF349 domain-containing protein [Marinospirillum sp. MEB164]|uniref:DUF349 domain-containing protein n=1 Tax=Marinospirillum alkalitolerans TaxID=3123374 RepID=A0ABW8PVY1_9GAMM
MNSLLVRVAPFIFKPSLADQDPAIRRLALQRLDLNHPTDQALFIDWLNSETQPELLNLGAAQLTQPAQVIDYLHQLNTSTADIPARQALQTQLKQGLTGLETEPACQLIAALECTATQLFLLAELESLALRQALLAQLSQQQMDESHWIEIALHNDFAVIRQLAAEQITSDAGLETLIKLSQKDKRIWRAAKDQLQQRRQQAAEQQAAEQQAQALIDQLSTMNKLTDDPLFSARLSHFNQRWQEILQAHPALPSSLQTAFAQHKQQAEAHLAAVAERAAQAEAEQARLAKQQADQAACLADLQNLVEAWIETPQPSLSERQAWQEQAHRLLEAAQNQEASRSFQQRCTQLSQVLASFAAAYHRWDALLPLLDQADLTEAQLHELAWPQDLPAPQALLEQQQRLMQPASKPTPAQAVSTGPTAQEVQPLLDALTQALEAGQLKAAVEYQQQLSHQLHASLPDALHSQFRQLSAQLNELKDWQGFVAAPKREALCIQMEHLAADQDMALSVKADKIQALQQEWRSLGAAAAHQALWRRFKSAADQAFEPCKAWFAEQAEIKNYHQQQRANICAELENAAQAAAFHQLDAQQLDFLIQQAHEEWKRFSPVNRQQGKLLAERFQQALQPFKQQLSQHRQRHADAKQALIDQAEALLQALDEQQISLPQAIEQSKQLQHLWRSIGAAAPGKEQKLWKRFRAACDDLFTQRDQQRQQQVAQQAGQLQQAKAQLQTAWQAVEQHQWQQAEQQFQSLQAITLPQAQMSAWQQQLGELEQRLNQQRQQQQRAAQVEQLRQKLDALPSASQLQDPLAAQKLVVQLAMLAKLPLSPDEKRVQLELQVEKLNLGLQQGVTLSNQEEITQLIDRWMALGGGRGDQDQADALSRRFWQAAQAYLAL